MGFYLTMMVIWILITAIFLAIGIGIGYGLQALFPELGLGISTVIGLLAPAISLHFITRLMSAMESFTDDRYEALMFEDMLDSMEKKQRKAPRIKKVK